MHLPYAPRMFLLLVSLSALLPLSSSTQPDDCLGAVIRPRSFRLVIKCNFTTLKDKQKEEIKTPTLVLYVPILYLIAFTIGLPANLLALWVLLFHTKKLPSTTLLINLTVSDLLLLLVLPFRVVYHFQGNNWAFGEPFCRLVTALFYGNMYSSVLCLGLVASDRYVALVHPFGAKMLRSSRISACMSVAVWVVALAAMLPLLMSQQSYKLDDPNITTCHDALPEYEQDNYFLPYFATLFSVCFLLPLLLILFCYGAVIRTLLAGGQRYTHAVKVTVLVLVVFVVCLLPSNILLLLHYSDSYLIEDKEDLYVPYMVSLAISTFNSCIDPFIFYYVSEDFREKVRRIGSCWDAERDSSSSGNHVTYSSSSAKSRSKVTLLSKSSREGTLSSEAGKA
ncbi:proteinase-activated receptor 4 [Osmerus eperlanus]|uniref:proteinase-activated receptor 4 n=1 Tax=Osmerus eperlanus TaxID=29151 RepID=UPI002E1187D8